MGMKHQLATEGVPFINMLFQHAVLFLLHLMLYAMKFRRSFEYWLVLMGCKLNSCCPCYNLGMFSSVLSPPLFLGMWSQRQILSHPFYPLRFYYVIFLKKNLDVIWQYLHSIDKCINTVWDLQPVMSPITGKSYMVKSLFTTEPLETCGEKHNLWLCELSKLSGWDKV